MATPGEALSSKNSSSQGLEDEAHFEALHTEARAVIDGQQSDLTDIDDKAMRAVRITAIIGGVVVSAGQLGVQFDSLLVTAGLGMLGFSILLGMVTFSESNLILGPTEEYILDHVNDDLVEDDWMTDMMVEMGGWVEINSEVVRKNGLLFTGQLSILAIGLLCTAAAAVTSTLGIPRSGFLYSISGAVVGSLTVLVGYRLYQWLFAG